MTAVPLGVTANSINIANPQLSTNQATVAATATLIAAARFGRGAITIVNHGTTAIYVGGPGVTSTTGALLPGAAGASLTIQTQAAIYGVTATGTQVVSAIEAF